MHFEVELASQEFKDSNLSKIKEDYPSMKHRCRQIDRQIERWVDRKKDR